LVLTTSELRVVPDAGECRRLVARESAAARAAAPAGFGRGAAIRIAHDDDGLTTPAPATDGSKIVGAITRQSLLWAVRPVRWRLELVAECCRCGSSYDGAGRRHPSNP
jgi:hypothetical protein